MRHINRKGRFYGRYRKACKDSEPSPRGQENSWCLRRNCAVYRNRRNPGANSFSGVRRLASHGRADRLSRLLDRYAARSAASSTPAYSASRKRRGGIVSKPPRRLHFVSPRALARGSARVRLPENEALKHDPRDLNLRINFFCLLYIC